MKTQKWLGGAALVLLLAVIAAGVYLVSTDSEEYFVDRTTYVDETEAYTFEVPTDWQRTSASDGVVFESQDETAAGRIEVQQLGDFGSALTDEARRAILESYLEDVQGGDQQRLGFVIESPRLISHAGTARDAVFGESTEASSNFEGTKRALNLITISDEGVVYRFLVMVDEDQFDANKTNMEATLDSWTFTN